MSGIEAVVVYTAIAVMFAAPLVVAWALWRDR
jgi:hypothetical protein